MVHTVKLIDSGEQVYMARSQAKKLLSGLEKFEKIILDFEDIRIVGQGFVDQVFRVFKQSHPNVEIEYTNTNEDVLFMIKRGIETPK